MKCDRRTLSVLAVIFAFLVLSQTFRSLFLFGARELIGQVTMRGNTMVLTTDDFSPTNLGEWTMRDIPSHPDNSRNQQLGYILAQTAYQWNQNAMLKIEGIRALEAYCSKHPNDLPAQAHLLRFSLMINSLKHLQDQKVLFDQAERMSKVAADCAKAEPANWYWRERQYHFLSLLGRDEEAQSVLTAQPYPTEFIDYVDDEVACKEALFEGGYMDLPRSAMLGIWTETMYSHFGTFRQIDDAVKRSRDPMAMRVAEIELGRSMLNSCPSALAGFVGLRYLRQGMWQGKKALEDWHKLVNPKEEAAVAVAYKNVVGSQTNWDRSVRLAKEDVTIRSVFPDPDLTLLYVGQIGPILISAGILAAVAGVAACSLTKLKIGNISNELLGWLCFLVGILLPNVVWNSWRYLSTYTFGNSYFLPALIALYVVSSYLVWRILEGAKRIIMLAVLMFAFLSGFAGVSLQASSVLFFVVFVFQRGRLPLSPWVAALATLMIGYHTAINLAYAVDAFMNLIAFAVGMVGLLAVSDRKLDPDQPRWASLSLGIASMLIGTFLMAQYDRGASTYFDSQKEINMKLKSRFASL